MKKIGFITYSENIIKIWSDIYPYCYTMLEQPVFEISK